MVDNFELYRTAVFIFEDARGGEGERKGDAKDKPRQGGVDWGKDFAVITAYNPDGAAPVVEREGASGKQEGWVVREQLRLNQAAHLRLRDDLLGLGARVTPVTGYSPDLVHQEPGWAAHIPLDVALRLGRLYRQDAIFWISAGQLHLVACTSGATPEPLVPWSTRLRTLP